MTRTRLAGVAAGVTLAVGAGISGLLVTLGSGEQAEYPAPVVTPLQLADCGETTKVINFCWEINPPDNAALGEAYRFDAYTVDPDDPTKVTVKTSWTHDISGPPTTAGGRWTRRCSRRPARRLPLCRPRQRRPRRRRDAMASAADLEPSELRVLRLVARGFTAEDISVATGWSIDSVREQTKAALRKLGARSSAQAVYLARERLVA